jgi:3-deoxy-D-manno-octulosonate 8-phosphate phosphatase (KDO 8-P phosphatase)
VDPRPLSDDFRARLRAVKLLCLDVDGVLTDGHLYWTEGNGWSQRFSVRDGYGIKLLQEAGVEICILSGGDVRSARARADSLGIKRAYFGISDKVAVFGDVAGTLGLGPGDAAFIGDELVDIPLLKIVGVPATVPEAVDEVLAVAHYVTRRPGGNGAVRELCDLIRGNRG